MMASWTVVVVVEVDRSGELGGKFLVSSRSLYWSRCGSAKERKNKGMRVCFLYQLTW